MDLAVIVPVGPDDEAWRELLPQLALLDVREIIVVFPTSQLADRRLPEPFDPRVQLAFAQQGRARQLNAGAAASSARWLWFLHADSVLGDRSADALAAHLRGHADALGYFDLHFLDDGPSLTALNGIGARLRSRWLKLPFGDQGFVLPQTLFDALGGFDPALESGEDHDLVWRARALGAPIRPVGAPLYTSARKYARGGWLRTTAQHLAATWQQARRYSRRARA